MSASSRDKGDSEPVEAVDAEFEPAPEGGAAASPAGPKKDRSGAGWFKISLFVIAAASIGGGSGWVAGQILQAPVFGGEDSGAALAERVSALEAAPAPASPADLNALQVRIAALEEAQNASGLRGDALEQLVRDVAALRSRVDDLERAPARAGEASGAGGDESAASAVETRLSQALEALEGRLDTAIERATTAQGAADEARSAAQQALAAAAGGGAGAGSSPELSTAVSDLEARQRALAERLDALDALAERMAGVEASMASADELDALAARVSDLDQAISALEQSSGAAVATGDAAQSLAARALAYAALRDASAGSQSFAAEFAELVRLWPDAPQRAALAPLARSGAPALDDLVEGFPADAVRSASGEADTYFGVLRIRRQSAQGPAAAIQAALQDGDFEDAIARTEALEGDAAAAAADWLDQARRRQSLEAGLRAMAAALRAEQEDVR